MTTWMKDHFSETQQARSTIIAAAVGLGFVGFAFVLFGVYLVSR